MILDKINRHRSLILESWAMSWPMTLIMFSMFLIGLTDVYVAGKFGKDIQAAYGVAYQLYFIFTIIAFSLTIGTVSVVSRLFTSGLKEEFQRAIGSSIIITFIAAASMSLLGLALARPIIYFLAVPGELKPASTQFMQVYSMGLVFAYSLYNTNGILRGCKRIKLSLLTMALVCVLNIILIFLLAFHSPLGFVGIAYATVISTIIGALVNHVFVRLMVPGALKFSWESAGQIVRIGWPAGLLQILWQLGLMVLYLILGALPKYNIETMAAFTNGLRLEAAIFLPAYAFNMSAAVVVGNLLGKKNHEDAFKSGLITSFLGVAIVSVLALAVILNARLIAGFLSNDRIVVRECVKYIYISFFAEPIMAWGVILGGGLSGAGDTKGVMKIVVLSLWLVRIPLAYFLAIRSGWGAAAVWWSMNLSLTIQAIFMTRRYFRKKWIISAEALVAGG
jgi:multidrug resistance protein, MATE family